MSEIKMKPVRNSVKAIIIENGKLLVNLMTAEYDKNFCLLPGGGQNPGDSFTDTLKRECMEELGAEIKVGKFIYVREYIGKNHSFAAYHSDYHQVEFMFLCELQTRPDMKLATDPDEGCLGFVWAPLTELEKYNLHPHILSEMLAHIAEDGANVDTVSEVYLGDVN